MTVHIKNRWHDEAATRSMTEVASALAFNIWRIAKDRTLNFHGEHFTYTSDEQRLDVLSEYLYFQVHVVDRLTATMLEPIDRQQLILQLALKLAEIIHDNSLDLLGTGDDHGSNFITNLNKRSNEYADFNFDTTGPSYPALRHLGYNIQQIMGTFAENRWVIDQVMDHDGGEVYKQITRTLYGLIP